MQFLKDLAFPTVALLIGGVMFFLSIVKKIDTKYIKLTITDKKQQLWFGIGGSVLILASIALQLFTPTTKPESTDANSLTAAQSTISALETQLASLTIIPTIPSLLVTAPTKIVIVQKLVKRWFNRICGATCQPLRKQNRNGQADYMRLKLILPVVEAETYNQPEECSHGCGGKEFYLRHEVQKRVCDTTHHDVKAKRYQCMNCRARFACIRKGSIRGSFHKEPSVWR